MKSIKKTTFYTWERWNPGDHETVFDFLARCMSPIFFYQVKKRKWNWGKRCLKIEMNEQWEGEIWQMKTLKENSVAFGFGSGREELIKTRKMGLKWTYKYKAQAVTCVTLVLVTMCITCSIRILIMCETHQNIAKQLTDNDNEVWGKLKLSSELRGYKAGQFITVFSPFLFVH